MIYEDARGGAKGAGALWFGGYRAVVQMWASRNRVAFVAVSPTTLKKWATGRGRVTEQQKAANPNIEKDRMRAAAMKRWPRYKDVYAQIDENRIDALWALAWGLEQV